MLTDNEKILQEDGLKLQKDESNNEAFFICLL